MNVGAILREAWRISTRSWPLWLVTTAMGVTFVPSFLISGSLGGLIASVTRPVRGAPAWMAQLRALPAGWIVAGFAAALVIMVLLTAITYLLQAAVIRGVAVAAERGATTLGEALNLGRRRVVNIALLSLTLGGALLTFSLLPLLGAVLARNLPGNASLLLLQLSQGLTLPVVTPLGWALYLVIMVLAVEDVRPRAAPGRAWAVFRKGWWAFLMVVAVSFVVVLPASFLLVAGVFPPVFAFTMNELPAAVGLLLVCGGGASLAAVPYLIFTTVFTTALFTLVFRAAAQLADEAATPSAPPA